MKDFAIFKIKFYLMGKPNFMQGNAIYVKLFTMKKDHAINFFIIQQGIQFLF